MKSSVRPPLIPTEGEQEQQEETLFGSIGRLLVTTGSSVTEIFGSTFPGFRKKPLRYQYQPQQHQNLKYSNAWPVQESFVIPDGDEPPSIETRTPTPRKTYAFMTQDAEKMQQLKQSRNFTAVGWGFPTAAAAHSEAAANSEAAASPSVSIIGPTNVL